MDGEIVVVLREISGLLSIVAGGVMLICGLLGCVLAGMGNRK